MKAKFYLLASLLIIINHSAKAQWSSVFANNNIYGSCFATSPDTCLVAGSGGLIYRTTSGGTNWDSVQTIFTTSWFNDVAFSSPNTGYICGGTAFGFHQSMVAQTSDGGQTWDSITSNAFGYEFSKLFCVTDSVVYFAGDAFVKTTDGGQTFQQIPIPFQGRISAVSFLNDSTGFIATTEYINSSKSIFRIAGTSDGGSNWVTNYIDSTDNTVSQPYKRINEIRFRNTSEGFGVTDNGCILKTNNGGLNWTATQLFNDSTHIQDIEISKTTGVGYIATWKYPNSSGTYTTRIYKTIDYGNTWQLNFDYSTDGIYNISMVTDEIVYFSCYGNIFKTTNGGITYISENRRDDSSISMYPNPANNQLNVQSIQNRINKIEILNMQGMIVLEENCANTNSYNIDVSELQPGIYILKFNFENHSQLKTLIIQ